MSAKKTAYLFKRLDDSVIIRRLMTPAEFGRLPLYNPPELSVPAAFGEVAEKPDNPVRMLKLRDGRTAVGLGLESHFDLTRQAKSEIVRGRAKWPLTCQLTGCGESQVGELNAILRSHGITDARVLADGRAQWDSLSGRRKYMRALGYIDRSGYMAR